MTQTVVLEVWANGKKSKTFVLAAGATLARQGVYDGFGGAVLEVVYFQHEDASGMSQRMTDVYGTVIEEEDQEHSPVESDPLGGNAGITSPYSRPRPPTGGNPDGNGTRNPRNSGEGEPNYVSRLPAVVLDGAEIPLAQYQLKQAVILRFS